MKVLFLDIDGVVNSRKTAQRHRGVIGIDPYLSLLVNRIIEATGCEVVLSSTWRLFKDSREEVRRQVCKFIDVTPHLTVPDVASVKRGYEIKAWLDDHPEVTRYAILDDDSDMLEEQIPNFFKTTWEDGLTEEIAKQVTEHLK